MARKPSVRVIVNRRALGALSAGMADGLEHLGQLWVQTVEPPDAAPYGEGLITTPDFGVWVNRKKVAGGATKPRSVKTRKGRIMLAAGEGFPGRFQELGTVHHPPQPHVTPAMLRVLPGAEGVIHDAALKRAERAG